VSNFVFWTFPLVGLALGIVNLWLWECESSTIRIARERFAGFFRSIGEPTSKVLWGGPTAMSSAERIEFRALASEDMEVLRLIDQYEKVVRYRRATFLLFGVWWVALMVT
jgi:hypothetical protein